MLRRETFMETRYTPGGDEFILVEFDESMSLEVNLLVQRVVTSVEAGAVAGVIDVCPANVSYLVRYDPDVVDFDNLVSTLKEFESASLTQRWQPFRTRVIDMPILFNDPWTYEVQMKFRDRVQDPEVTDIEYLTRINGLPTVDSFISAITAAPHMATLTGFSLGVVWSYQLVPRAQQLQGPKYLQPRTETPARAFALGGAFTAVYPSESPGGYPMLGRAAAPAYDPAQRLPDFEEKPELVGIGDICNYRSVDRDEYDSIQKAVSAGTYRFAIADVEFDPQALIEDPSGYCSSLTEALYS
ncbi:MAG: carboxyltransferase domain-containing protein [Rhodococcus sp. (in: high G+C Gram-positive bacteria)]